MLRLIMVFVRFLMLVVSVVSVGAVNASAWTHPPAWTPGNLRKRLVTGLGMSPRVLDAPQYVRPLVHQTSQPVRLAEELLEEPSSLPAVASVDSFPVMDSGAAKDTPVPRTPPAQPRRAFATTPQVQGLILKQRLGSQDGLRRRGFVTSFLKSEEAIPDFQGFAAAREIQEPIAPPVQEQMMTTPPPVKRQSSAAENSGWDFGELDALLESRGFDSQSSLSVQEELPAQSLQTPPKLQAPRGVLGALLTKASNTTQTLPEPPKIDSNKPQEKVKNQAYSIARLFGAAGITVGAGCLLSVPVLIYLKWLKEQKDPKRSGPKVAFKHYLLKQLSLFNSKEAQAYLKVIGPVLLVGGSVVAVTIK